MVLSTRGILAIGLGMTGLAFLVGPSLGQQHDGRVRKTAGPAARVKPPDPIAPFIGTVDIDTVFKTYNKFKAVGKEFNAALLARKNELMKLMSEAQEEAQMLTKLTPGTDDFKKHEDRVTELKARHEAGREQAQREFALREAENVATIYKEVQAMVARVAVWHNMNYIVKVSNQTPSASDPNSVVNALQNTMVYADPRNDITKDVIYNLNNVYEAAHGAAPKAANGAPAAGQPANPPQADGR